MMASEPSIDNTADVSASSQPRPVYDAQDGDLQPPTITEPFCIPEDIANKRITSVEDQINSADVSVSGGSDTEASRAEWAKQKDGDKGHGRTGSSVKKPATFKAVSVNRTFLAAKSSSIGTSARTTDNKLVAGSSTPPSGSVSSSASRPRLVAKTGGATGASSPRFSSVVNGKPGAAPDPAAVWNKNRPTPAPEPKKLTDEELKKYGIHMASRLNEEDAQGQNKWADIDDDDEDWAPEAITWGDGTKTTLPHSDEPPPPPPLPDNESASFLKSASATAAAAATQEKPTSPANAGPANLPVPKASGLPSGKGLILKSATQEKPILVAKPPAPPAPAKSPWAPLPPVDKVPPVPIELPYAARGPHREQWSQKPMTMPLPREALTDDFNRTAWRDRVPHTNRELFNSKSGRYEPVIDRHGPPMPMPSDPMTRHPALLQRAPPQQSDQPEPSPAFQTSRTAQEAPFGRRRGSSIVSGGSGSFMHRMGKANEGPMPPEFLAARRDSFTGSAEGPLSPAALSTHGHRPDWATRPSPRAAFAAPHRGPPSAEFQPGPPPPPLSQQQQQQPPPQQQQQPPPLADDIEFQKKLMREGVELARKRRQEEEAREEAARRERIQKKLEALGPAPERKSDMKENAVHKPVQIQQRAPNSNTAEQQQQQQQQQQPPPSSQPTKHEDLNNRAEPAIASNEVPPTSVLPPTSAPRRLSQGQDLKPANNVWGGPGTRQDRFSAWASGTPRNVWGSPDSDRGLGNGTFNPDLGRVPGTSPQPSQHNATPSPIAPPNSQPTMQTRPQISQTNLGLRSARYGAAPAAPAAGPAQAAPGISGTDLANKWVASVAENDKKLSAARLAERAGREKQLAERGMTMEDAQPAIKDTWRPVQVPGDGSRHTVGAVEVQSHPTPGPWKSSRDDFVAREAAPLTEESISSTQPGAIGPGGMGTPQSRPSRFFPTKDARSEMGHAAASTRPSSPSPPPPTMEGHPVYEGDVSHPHVSLPRPHPVVKLPPAMDTSQPSQQPKINNVWASRPSFKDSARAPAQEAQQGQQGSRHGAEGSQGNWQDKINNLLNGGKGQQHKHAVIDAASKIALDQTTLQDTTTVALPYVAITAYSWEDAKSASTKPMAEECFEEQEMGSLPQIRFPHKAPEAAWQLAAPKPFPKKFAVEATAKEPFPFPSDVSGGGNVVTIYLQGMSKPKTVSIPFAASRSSRGGHGRPSPRHRGGPGHGPRGGKRELPSNTYGDSESNNSNNNPRSTGPRGGRGGFRARGGSETWSRYSSSQKQTSMPA